MSSTSNVKKYPKLSFVFKIILILSHGQDAFERGFNFQDCSVYQSISFDLRHTVWKLKKIISFELKPKTLGLANELLLSAKSAISKHEKAKKQICEMK